MVFTQKMIREPINSGILLEKGFCEAKCKWEKKL